MRGPFFVVTVVRQYFFGQGSYIPFLWLCREKGNINRLVWETLGDRHPRTLVSRSADLFRALGDLAEAEAVLGNAVEVAQEVFGSKQMRTLVITAKAARLQHAQPGGAAAGKELLGAGGHGCPHGRGAW